MPRADLIALSFVRGLARQLLYPMLKGEPIPDNCRLPFPDASPAASLEEFLAQAGCAGDVRRVAASARRDAARAMERAAARAIRVTAWQDEDYPFALAQIFDPPLVLWTRGECRVLAGVTVAVVGSRAASPYGEQAACRLGHDLASSGIVVASGMARGIDAAAHRGALSAGGRTVAVLGCGPDVVYPPEHAQLAAEIAGSGVILSEYPPGTAPTKWTFPRRNRIISGLARGVVVVEASRKSGALITAGCALEQGRDVMAVPGNVLSERHRGSHTLLKAGASLVESARDVLEQLHLPLGARALDPAPAADIVLLSALDEDDARHADAIAEKLHVSAAELLPRLLELELKGLVRRVPGCRFLRAAPFDARNAGSAGL